MHYKDRVVACFKALASGDAIGKQTETLSHPDVRRWYPDGICGFHGRPGDVIPRYAGNARYEWRIGETTDDTEQTLAVARALITTGTVSHAAVGRELLKCRKSIHPGVSMWAFHEAGEPGRVATDGDGCGAAMRVAPVGVLYSPERWDALVRGAYEASIPTHGGQMAICAAAAVAGAISGAIEQRPSKEVLGLAIRAAQDAEELTLTSRGETRVAVSDLIEEFQKSLSARGTLVARDLAESYLPDRDDIKVPLAINLALITESAEQTILLAANLGGDADSVASIGAGIAGALRPDTVNERWFDVVRSVNGDDIVAIAQDLAEIHC